MGSLILFLLLSQTAPPQDYVGKVPNFIPHQHHINTIVKDQSHAGILGPKTCFTMRSYVFTRQDGNAPVLVGTTTCTPDEILRMDQVKNPPRVRLVPADAPVDDERR